MSTHFRCEYIYHERSDIVVVRVSRQLYQASKTIVAIAVIVLQVYSYDRIIANLLSHLLQGCQ